MRFVGAPPRGQLASGFRIAGQFGASLGDVARPLGDQQFRWLWLATFAWNFARWMEMTVTSWVALELTGSPWLVALAGVCRNAFLPVAGPVTGALSDRIDRVKLIKLAQWGNVLVIGAVALALGTGHGAYWQIILSSLWLGASWGIDWPSRRALVADMVGPERVLQAVVLDNVTQNISRVLGPLLGGFLLAAWGGPGAFSALAVAFFVASLTMIPVASAARKVLQAGQSMWRELAAGLEYARADRVIWAVLVITVLMNLLLFPYHGLLSVFAEQVLHVGPVGLGYMGAANGIGASLGLFLLSPLKKAQWQARAFAVGSCVGCVALAFFSGSQWFQFSLIMLLVSGIGTSAFGTMQSTIILSRTDPAMRGRVMGLLACAIGSAPVGALQMGLLIEAVGAPLAVGLNCLVCGVLVALIATRANLFAGGRRAAPPVYTVASA